MEGGRVTELAKIGITSYKTLQQVDPISMTGPLWYCCLIG